MKNYIYLSALSEPWDLFLMELSGEQILPTDLTWENKARMN